MWASNLQLLFILNRKKGLERTCKPGSVLCVFERHAKR